LQAVFVEVLHAEVVKKSVFTWSVYGSAVEAPAFPT
jgi:hypothetical protein